MENKNIESSNSLKDTTELLQKQSKELEKMLDDFVPKNEDEIQKLELAKEKFKGWKSVINTQLVLFQNIQKSRENQERIEKVNEQITQLLKDEKSLSKSSVSPQLLKDVFEKIDKAIANMDNMKKEAGEKMKTTIKDIREKLSNDNDNGPDMKNK